MPGRALFLMILILPLIIMCTSRKPAADVKSSSIAGRWYPSDRAELEEEIDAMLRNAPVNKGCGNPLVLIVPHAGYSYSGKTAASGYRVIGTTGSSSVNPELIVIIGTSHHAHFRGCATLPADYIETPLGMVKLDRKTAAALHADSLFRDYPDAFGPEHSVEIQLPFLQRIFGERMTGSIQVLPLLAGEVDDEEAARAAFMLASEVKGRKPLFIVSTDFTHYGPDYGYMPFRAAGTSTSDKIRELDDRAVNYILKKDCAGFSDYTERTGITICGRNPVKIALSLPVEDFRASRVSYDMSGNITGNYTNSVSYASILFCGTLAAVSGPEAGSEDLTPGDKRFLLKTARENIESWLVSGRGIDMPANVPGNCMLKRGAFVTLKIRGELRGCVGYVSAEMPLVRTVIENSYNAAFRDSRFTPLQKDELKDITIEISVLTEPSAVRSVNEIVTGRDGLIVQRGMMRGLLLPQVPSEQGWDRDTFLSMTCLKAGLPDDCWKDKSTAIYRFQAIVFNEEKL